MYLVSSKSFLCEVIFGRNINKGLIFLASLQPIKYLNPFYQKEPYLTLIFYQCLHFLLK